MLLAAFALVFTACSKDDDEDDDINASAIEGEWLITQETDGVDESDNYTWVFDDGELTWYDDGDFDESFEYSISGKKLTISDGPDRETFTINTLTSSKLDISSSDGYRIAFRKLR